MKMKTAIFWDATLAGVDFPATTAKDCSQAASASVKVRAGTQAADVSRVVSNLQGRQARCPGITGFSRCFRFLA